MVSLRTVSIWDSISLIRCPLWYAVGSIVFGVGVWRVVDANFGPLSANEPRPRFSH